MTTPLVAADGLEHALL